jgi:hypothetical protein
MIRTCLFQDPFYLYMEDQIVRSLLPHTKDLARATEAPSVIGVSLLLRLLFLFNEDRLCSFLLP